MNRRSFMKLTGTAIGIGVLYQAVPLIGEATDMARQIGRHNGEAVTPFSFVQMSDAHVGFSGPPDPLGTKAFEHAVEMVNRLPRRPELVLFTGDLTHDTEDKDQHAARMKQFREIAGRLKVDKIKLVPGEHDAGLDGGALFREHFGEISYSFDHRGVHFVALDNVSRAKPEVGAERIAWLKQDLERFPKTAPIVVFTHRPLFDLKPEWEWFTSDGDKVMNVLAPFQNVTVLYGHIHRDDEHEVSGVKHFGARSLIFAFPDPASPEKKPLPFNKDQPFKNLGIRVLDQKADTLAVKDVELTLREYSGINGIQQMAKEPR